MMMSTGKRDIYGPVDEYETLSRWSTVALVSSMVSCQSEPHEIGVEPVHLQGVQLEAYESI